MKTGALKNPTQRKRHDTVFTEAIKKNENIRSKLGFTKDNSTKIERVPLSEALIFLFYTVIFFAVLSQQIRVYSSQLAYGKLTKTVLNQVRIGDQFVPINPLKVIPGQIHTLNDIQTFLRTVIDPVTYNTSDFMLISNKMDFNYEFLTPFTALRMTQKRINKVSGENSISEYAWDPSGKISKDAYGTGDQFVFSEQDDGFIQFFNLPLFQNSTEANTMLDSLIADGYFDEFTQQLLLDLGFYQSVNELACFFRLSFKLSAAGFVDNTAVARCFNLNPYGTAAGIIRGVFEVIFFLLTFYYFVIEFMKIANSIRNEKLRNQLAIKEDLKTSGANRALDRGASSISGIVNGILTHIQSLWSFLDVAIIILALSTAGIWIQFISNIQLKSEVKNLTIENGKYQLNSPTDITNFYSLNVLLTDLFDKFETYYRVCALNGVLLLLKNAKNFSNFFSSLKHMIQFTISALTRILPFLVLFILMVVAFAFGIYILFASEIESVSSFPKAFFYVSTNIMRNYRDFDSMKDAGYVSFYLYFLGFTFVICFIMVNMFLIYIIAEYRNFVRQKVKEERANTFNKKPEARTHLVSAITIFIRKKIYMRFLKCFRKKKYEKIIKQEEALRTEAERDSILEHHFNYSLDIQTNLEENEKKHKKFTNDFLTEKIELKEKRKLVKVFWASFFVFLSLVAAIVITAQRHENSDAYGMGTAIQNAIPNLQNVNPDIVGNQLMELSGIPQLKNWLLYDFPSAISTANLSYLHPPGTVVNGSFIGTYYLIALNQVTITIRRKKPDTADDMALNQLNNVTLPFTFDWDAPPANSDEFIGNIISQDSARTYFYDYTHHGYHFSIGCDDYNKTLQDLETDGVIDSSLNSLVIEIPMIHMAKRIPIYFRAVISVDNDGNINNQVTVNTIQTPFTSPRYKTRDSFVLALELIMILVFLVYLFVIVRSLREQNEIYNHWYQIYIYYFPILYKRKRWLEKPEIIRKLEFLLSKKEVIRILLAVLLCVNICFAIAILPGSYSLHDSFTQIISAAQNGSSTVVTVTSDSLLSTIQTVSYLDRSLRVLDFLTINCLIAHLLFFYSVTSYFNFLTVTLKRIVTPLFNMIIIMLFVYICFSFFLVLMLGETDGDFTNLLHGFRTLFGLSSGITNTQIDEISNYQDVFLILFFFYPFLIISKFVISNIFISILYRSYNLTKGEWTVQEKNILSVKEFFILTFYLVCPKRKKKSHEIQELTQEFTKSVNPNLVMDRFRGTLEQGRAARDVILWSTLCAKDIMQEYEIRKKIRRKARQVISQRLQDAENDYSASSFKNLILGVRLSEYQVRELYWSYFRISQRRLMMFYTSLSKYVQNVQSRVRVVQIENIKSEAIVKLSIYITDLETKVASNFRDLEKIKKIFKKHKMQNLEDLDQEERAKTPEKGQGQPSLFPEKEDRRGSIALSEERLMGGSTDRDREYPTSHFKTASREVKSNFSRDSGRKIMIEDMRSDRHEENEDEDEEVEGESGSMFMSRVSKNWNK